jgi:predicted permease
MLAFLRDCRYAFRGLRRSPGLAITIVAFLGFGIGAVTLVHSWQQGLVQHPLPAVPRIDELVTIRSQATNGSIFTSHPEYLDWREQARSVSGLAACSLYLFGVMAADAPDNVPEPVYGMFVSANFFDVLDVRVPLGRSFRRDDDQPGHDNLVGIVSDRFWKSRLHRRQDVVGHSLRVNGRVLTIVGVAAPGFGGTLAGASFDLWVPLSAYAAVVADGEPVASRANRWLDVTGRRQPGIGLAAVREEFAAIGARMAESYAESRNRTIQVGPLDTGTAQQLRPLFTSLVALTGIVLLLVCSNVANLLLVRGSARSREIGVRFALGATRARVVRLLMIENVVLASAGAAAGIGLARWGHATFTRLLPPTTIPLDVPAPIDERTIAFVVVLTSLTVLVFGVVPALMTSRLRITDALGGARGATAGRGRLRALLVAAQLALCLTTLVSAMLFLRRAEHVKTLDRGFADPERVLLVQTEAAMSGYRDLRRWQHALDTVAERVGEIPGVRSATWATFVPLGYVGYTRRDVDVEAYTPQPGETMRVLVNGVGPGYFDLMGASIRQGRAIAADDRPGEPFVAVVNETFVRRFWPAASPLGRRVTVAGRPLTVVGVARDGRYDYRAIDEPPPPLVYYALAQQPGRFVTLHVRTEADALSMAPAVRTAIAAVDPQFTSLAPLTLDSYTAAPLIPTNMGLKFLGVLGAAALALSATGLQAIVAYGVAIRRREIGIRLALGASTWQVIGIFLRQTAGLTAAGLLTGLACTAGTVLVLRHQMAYFSSVDRWAVFWPCALLAAAALSAGYLAARRSTAIDPVTTLRTD